MNRPHRHPLVLLGGLLAGSALGLGAAAQTPSPSPVPATAVASPTTSTLLAEAVAAAWQLALARHETQGRRQRAVADQEAATAAWAAPPVLELTHRSDRLMQNRGDQETEIGLAWSLWQPGQRSAQGAAADADLAVADAGAALARWQVAGEVREAAWQVQLRQAERILAEAQLQSLASLSDDVARRVQAGDLARVDGMAAEAERLDAAAALTEAQQAERAALTRWSLLTGWSQIPALAAESPDASPDASPDLLAAAADGAALQSHPLHRLALAQVDGARQRLAALRTDRRAPPELTLGWRQGRGERGEAALHSLAVGLRLPFGTDDRNRPREAAALAEASLAEAAEARTRDRLSAEADAARLALQAAVLQLTAQRTRAALLRERARLIERSFRAGESALPELLRALSAAAQADAAQIRQHAALGLAQARHQQSLGILP